MEYTIYITLTPIVSSEKSSVVDVKISPLYSTLINDLAKNISKLDEKGSNKLFKILFDRNPIDEKEIKLLLSRVKNKDTSSEELKDAVKKLDEISSNEQTKNLLKIIDIHFNLMDLFRYKKYPWKRVKQFIEVISNDHIQDDEAKLRLNESLKEPYSTLRDIIVDISRIHGDQKSIISAEDSNCKMYCIIAHLKNQPYGCIFVAHKKNVLDKEGNKFVLMQEITKFLIPTLVQGVFPEYRKYLPSLNDILIPAVENLAKDIGASRIYVGPHGHQAKLLSKYGFVKYNGKWPNICEYLGGPYAARMYKDLV